MTKPINIEEAKKRGLLTPAKHGIHTFSNSDDYFGWAGHNCQECWFYELEGAAGEHCAFEGAALIGIVSPELAEMFGWTRHEKYPDSWVRPRQCPFFKQRPDKGDDGDTPPPPPDPDPQQLVLIADPTEDIALARPSERRVLSGV